MTKDEPVAWGMKGEDGLILDVICPDEHDRVEGSYTIPLYTHPKEWVGLNGADWNDFNFLLSNDPHRVADWVEKLLRERNT
jgi:hypothetical protein